MRQEDELEGASGDRSAERTTCGLAIASLILGILGVTCFTVLTGIPALILGFVALGRVRKSRGLLAGGGLAIAGIILGALSILIIPVLAGFLVPTLLRGRSEAYKVQCANNLKQLYAAAESYLHQSGTMAFPFQAEGPIASFQALVDFDKQRLDPGLFICPEGEEMRAARAAHGGFILTSESCSYELFPRRIRDTQPSQMLIYDKGPHHAVRGSHGGRMVLFADGSIEFLTEDEFQARYPRTPGKPLPAEDR